MSLNRVRGHKALATYTAMIGLLFRMNHLVLITDVLGSKSFTTMCTTIASYNNICASAKKISTSLTRIFILVRFVEIYYCDVYGKGYAHVSYLNRHRRIHTNGKPYVCKDCRKRFNQTSPLNNHVQFHAATVFG